MTKNLLIFILLMTTTASEDFSQDRSQARSMVVTRYGIVAAESPLAAQVGATILADGGNAVDAAIATNAMMGLVAPMSNGIGGDLFAIVYEAKSGKLYGLNASGWAPSGLSIDYLQKNGISSMPYRGIHSVTVPGTVDGWTRLLKRFGTKRLQQLLAPTIRYAEEGFPVTELVAGLWSANADVLNGNAVAARTFLPNGRPPKVGDIFRNPALASSLKEIAEHGRDAFYRGSLAERILACCREFGGTMTKADLADFSSEWVEPISTTYRGWMVYEIPPNGQGIAALMMLNIMENFPIPGYRHNSAEALHVMIEAKKLAYGDMLRYVADQRFSKVAVSGMLDKGYGTVRAKLIDTTKANCSPAAGKPPAPGDDTIYLSVVDEDGNMVSLIQSNYENFGSGLVPDGAGFALQNRGALFSLDATHANALAGRKRPLHTIIPAFMTKGDVKIAFGIMGGWNQSQAHAQFVSNVVDYGMNIQAAVEAARFRKTTFEGCDLQIEGRVPASVRAQLEAMGHQLEVRGDFSPVMGGGQAVLRNFTTGVNFGASDPRKDGMAIPEQAGKK
ncbi:MAG TPA: gamma-glutamyltransferase [Bacteroidetes bacterium]|nr:gamma-glutamyltransferase [Bacteroidota bacterium]